MLCDEAIVWHFSGWKPWDVECWLDAIEKGADWHSECKALPTSMEKNVLIDDCILPKYAALLALWRTYLDVA